jgi:hypothetical protein
LAFFEDDATAIGHPSVPSLKWDYKTWDK